MSLALNSFEGDRARPMILSLLAHSPDSPSGRVDVHFPSEPTNPGIHKNSPNGPINRPRSVAQLGVPALAATGF